jgi:hypothetical protein
MPFQLHRYFKNYALDHPTLTCLLFLVAYWVLLRFIVICTHLATGRPISDGPSLFPTNTVWSAIALGIAWSLNLFLRRVGYLTRKSVHLHRAGPETFAIIAEAHVRVVGEQGHRHGGVHDAFRNHQGGQALAERIVVNTGLPD